MEQRIVYKPYVEELDNNDSLFINQGNTLRQIKKNKTGFVTREDIADEVAPMVYGAYITKSASGSIASFSDGGDGVPMKKCIVSITPKQSGTGTPAPDNVRPISGWESVSVNVSGKNLYSYGNLTSKNIYRATTIAIDNDPNSFYLAGAQGGMDNPQLLVTAWGSTRTYYGLKFRENTTVRLTCTVKNYTADCNGYVALCYKATNSGGDAGVTMLSRTFFNSVGETEISLTGEIPADNYFVLSTSPASKSTDFTLSQYPEVRNLQLELGTTATDYEPYTSTTTTTSLGRTVYGGTLDLVSGVLTVDRAMITYNGSENWGMETGTQYTGSSFYVAKPSGTGNKYDVFQSNITNKFTLSMSTAQDGVCITTGYFNCILGNILGINNVADFKTWLSSHNMQIVYPLATPQTYQLTPTEVSTLLGENNVWADSGAVEVTYRADPTLAYNELANAVIALGGNV